MLRAVRANVTNPSTGGAPVAPVAPPVGITQAEQEAVDRVKANAQALVAQQQGAVAPTGNMSAQISNLNGNVLENIDGLGNAGNFVSMDGSEFFYKSADTRVSFIDLIVKSGKRYYQWVEENGDQKTFHDSEAKLNDLYKLKFEIHWEEEAIEGEITEPQFHMPTASSMRFIDYVKELAKAGYGIGNVVTRLTISRQVQKNSTNRYSRAEFTMIGFINANNEIVDVANGISTVNKK